MIALSCTNIIKSYGIETILENISFTASSGDKIGLIGVNGAGKTTLMKILTGEVTRDSGDIFTAKDMSIGYLAQHTETDSTTTAFDYCLEVFEDILSMEQKMRALEKALATATPESSEALLRDYAFLQETFDQASGYAVDSNVRGVLNGLGFEQDAYEKPLQALSGGQKSRVGIARLLLKKPDILLLDEPTNHLDITAIKWLETYLREYSGTLILISHDRYFLDQVTTKIYEIEQKHLTIYTGNYSQYLHVKKERFEAALKKYEIQQKEVQKQEALIRGYKERGTEKLAKRAKSREKRLDKVERIDKPNLFKAHFSIHLQSNVQSGKEVLSVSHLSKSYGGAPVIKDLSFDIYRGEKIGLIGPNGVGKTTLFKLLLQQIATDSGSVRYGHHVDTGYYDQELQNLSENATVLDEIHDAHTYMTLTEVRSLLGAFLFAGDDIEKSVTALSGGEKSRLSLLKLMLSGANFLLLDEPTNHLDLQAKEALEEALSAYDGTVFAISHDRYFLNTICTKIFELTPAGLNVYVGNYDYYLQKLEETLREDNESDDAEQLTKTKQREIMHREKEKKSEERALKASLEKCEHQIHLEEEALHKLQLSLCDEAVFSDSNRAKEVNDAILAKTESIESLYLELDEIISKM